VIRRLKDTMNSFYPSEHLEPEDISYALAVNYFAALGLSLIENLAYDNIEEVAEVIGHSFDGNAFEMQVYWYDTSRPSVEDVAFNDLGINRQL